MRDVYFFRVKFMIPVVSTVYLGYEASFTVKLAEYRPSIFCVFMERDGVAVHTLARKKKNEGKLVQDSATLLAWVANHNIELVYLPRSRR